MKLMEGIMEIEFLLARQVMPSKQKEKVANIEEMKKVDSLDSGDTLRM